MTPDEQIVAVQSYRALAKAGNWSEARSHLHSDVSAVVPDELPYGGTWTGLDGLRDLETAIRRNWTSWEESPTPAALASADTRVYREVSVKSTGASTGTTIEMFQTELYSFREDRIAEVRHYYADATLAADACRP